MRKTTRALMILAAVGALSLFGIGCESTQDANPGEMGEHPTGEHPTGEHPTGEHPK